MKIVTLADTHLVPHGERYGGNDPWTTLERSLQVIDKLRPDLVIHAGDIVARPAEESVYSAFFEYLEDSQRGNRHRVPWHLIPGNHDDIAILARFGRSLPVGAGIHVRVEPGFLREDGSGPPIVLIPEGVVVDDIRRVLVREEWRVLVTHRHLTPTGAPWIDETIHPLRELIISALISRPPSLAITGHSHRWAMSTTREDGAPISLHDTGRFSRILTLDGLATTFDHRAPSWALYDHAPSVALIDTERLDQPGSIERISVTSAHP